MARDTNTLTTTPRLVDRREAARRLGVSPGTIDNLRTAGELPSVKLRSRRLYDVADLERLIESQKVTESPAAADGPCASADESGRTGGTR